ncbi:C40 family peptidase [Arenimonas sp.]|uniref:C40 family peptidase n=1 Tax=Arenimonas sp. TaxID=1872635 RepID=UPI0025BA321C|nr:C40 family peptidase [Arenimonas sp.]
MHAPIALSDAATAAIRAHAAQVYPRECCGLLLRHGAAISYAPCRNLATAPEEQFILDPEAWALAEDTADSIEAIVHSHPNASANPSMADRVMCERTGLPWLVIGWPSGALVWCDPCGFEAPLIGREFTHGVLDCYTLVRDWYWREHRIQLPDFPRTDLWWERDEDLYLDNFAAAGFVEVTDLQPGDGLLMQVLSLKVNHAAVYLGDNVMLHHLYGRLSGRDVYGGYWQRHTRKIVRHRDLLGAARAA